MTEQNSKSTFWVMAMFSVAMLPQLVRMPVPVAVMTLLPLVWRLAAELRGWKPLPAIVRHSSTALGLVILFMAYGDFSGRRAAVSLLTLMLALKMIECYRIRDARLVISFSLFLCATQFLFAQGIMMPVYGVVTTLLALVALSHLQRDEAWSHEQRRPPPMKASFLSELGFIARLLALAVPAGLAFFVLFPRLASPLWGIPETTLDAKTGLSDSMSPGSIQTLFMDDSPAFRVEFEGDVPRSDQLYWRGPVLWSFDGKTWRGSFYSHHVEAVPVPEPGMGAWAYTVQIEPNERKWLFALDYPVAAPSDARRTIDFQVIRNDPILQLTQYSLRSNPEFIDAPELSLPLRTEALDIPEQSNPRTRELVARWRRETPDDRGFIQRVLTHFNQEAFHYSLESPLLGLHPVDEFLFDTRMGYCEHYASSFAVMMRMAGIPARIVTGYQGGWFSELGNYLLVRQSDAHAWVEVWLPQNGWTRVDPTAAVSPSRIRQGPRSALDGPRHLLDFDWLRDFSNSIDIVQQRWNDWVIEYGARRQAEIFSPLGLGKLSPSRLVIALFVVLGICGAVLIPIVLRVRGPSAKDPAQQAWQQFLAKLKKAGFEARASSGPTELGEAAALQLPGFSPAIRQIADLYSRSRYAMYPPSLKELKLAIADFRPNNRAA